MKKNIGTVDKYTRLILAFLASAVYALHLVKGWSGQVLLFVGGILLATALIDFCPFYALFKTDSLPKDKL